jgi:ribosomal protein S18 acetylase RimI-like enzyme
MEHPVKLSPFYSDSPLLVPATNVYVTTWGFDVEDSLDFVTRYSEYPGFYGLAALSAEKVVGMGFGVLSSPGHWWHDAVARSVGANHPALQNAWVLVEICVLEQYRNLNIGTLVHDQLLKTQLYPRALLSTRIENNGARRFYEGKGWKYLSEQLVFDPGDPGYVVMNKEMEPLHHM